MVCRVVCGRRAGLSLRLNDSARGERPQTANHIFGLALAKWRASAPRIQYSREGTKHSILFFSCYRRSGGSVISLLLAPALRRLREDCAFSGATPEEPCSRPAPRRSSAGYERSTPGRFRSARGSIVTAIPGTHACREPIRPLGTSAVSAVCQWQSGAPAHPDGSKCPPALARSYPCAAPEHRA